MAKQVEINSKAPDFALPDFNGHLVSLSDYRQKQRVLLVFNRGLT